MAEAKESTVIDVCERFGFRRQYFTNAFPDTVVWRIKICSVSMPSGPTEEIAIELTRRGYSPSVRRLRSLLSERSALTWKLIEATVK